MPYASSVPAFAHHSDSPHTYRTSHGISTRQRTIRSHSTSTPYASSVPDFVYHTLAQYVMTYHMLAQYATAQHTLSQYGAVHDLSTAHQLGRAVQYPRCAPAIW
eukprot:3026002-Rhodomonas_salina.3